MSYYYDYFLGYRTPDKKIYPLGPFDHKGMLHAVLTRTWDYASDIRQSFLSISKDELTDELKDAYIRSFVDPDELSEEIKDFPLKWLSVKDLPGGDFMERGYFLISEVKEYEKDYEETGGNISASDYFSEKLSPMIYAAKLEAELASGVPKRVQNVFSEDSEYQEPLASEYMYFAYPDYSSVNFESFILRKAARSFEDYDTVPKDSEIVIIQEEG